MTATELVKQSSCCYEIFVVSVYTEKSHSHVVESTAKHSRRAFGVPNIHTFIATTAGLSK